MPVGVVKSKRDEHLWDKAKQLAAKGYPAIREGSSHYWKVTMGIYKKMHGGDLKKSAGLAKAVGKTAVLPLKVMRKLPWPVTVAGTAYGTHRVSKAYRKKKIQSYEQSMNNAQRWIYG